MGDYELFKKLNEVSNTMMEISQILINDGRLFDAQRSICINDEVIQLMQKVSLVIFEEVGDGINN